MKKILLSMFCLLFCVITYAQQKTVNVATAGTLATLLNDDEVENLTDLKLTGNLNGTDINLIRKMGGGDNYWNYDGENSKYVEYGHLQNLDLSEVHIVSGGDPYLDIWKSSRIYTKDDVLTASMFACCDNLITVSLPKTVKTVEEDLFNGCYHLKTVEFPEVSELGGHMFYDCPSLEKVDLPKSVTKIGDAFFCCANHLKEVSMPSVKELKDSVFAGCTCLEKLYIGGIEKIDIGTFEGDLNLKYVYLPTGVTSICDGAFKYCSNLVQIISMSTIAPNCDTDAFSGVNKNCTVYVQIGSGANYKSAPEWQKLNIMEKDLSGIIPSIQENPKEVARYNAAGIQIKKVTRGINIIRMNNGTTKKVWIK